jgi:chemotaxis protein CheC
MSSQLRYSESDLDRMRELGSIGAGHAANALARLTGRTCEMGVPTLRSPGVGGGPARGLTGVLFECEGGPGGVLALLFPTDTCLRLLTQLLGEEAGALRSPASRSALCEVGNILASHAANALGELLGVTVLPSVPRLALEDADAALAALLERRGAQAPQLCVESTLRDRARELDGLFVYAPDHVGSPRVG